MKQQTFTSIWDAIENSAGSAANMRVRAELMVEIERYVRGKELSQAEAAKKLDVTLSHALTICCEGRSTSLASTSW